jgi:hypothetical protein
MIADQRCTPDKRKCGTPDPLYMIMVFPGLKTKFPSLYTSVHKISISFLILCFFGLYFIKYDDEIRSMVASAWFQFGFSMAYH